MPPQGAGQVYSLWLLCALACVNPLRRVGQVGDGVQAVGDAGQVLLVATSSLL